jgi:glycosyltransferase involved in cell wall biosynthesis
MPRFSLVVTTTDRPSLLPAAIRGVLGMDFDDYELIVSDNFSKRPATDLLADVNDRRLRIIRTSRRLPGPDHWEFAWDHVTGDYVMFLGDDNALHPGILSFADQAIRDHRLELMSWRVCSYFHPNWDVTYGPFPNRGNVLGIQPGTTGNLYICDQDKVLKLLCQQLRLSACYPCMLNFLFRKSRADFVRARMGRFFWAPYPDISSGCLILGTIPAGSYGFFDGFGAIGGWSRDSNMGNILSRNRKSGKIWNYFEEFGGQDLYPHHEFKFVTITNGLAAPISQGRALMPDNFAGYDINLKALALRSIDDMYVDRTTPWVDDPSFLAEFERFLQCLPPDIVGEAIAYRDRCRAMAEDRKSAEQQSPPVIRNRADARAALLRSGRMLDREDWRFAWRLFCASFRNPFGRHWTSGGTTYIDMGVLGARDVADAARNLPKLLELFDRRDANFATQYQNLGLLGDPLALESELRQAATVRRRPASLASTG